MRTFFTFRSIKLFTSLRSNSIPGLCLLFLFSSCAKTGYLDVDASASPPLAAKISFVNALPSQPAVNFWTYNTQVTAAPIGFGLSSPYVNTQFGDVQINVSPASGSTYLSSRQFGNNATFTATGGPNGPIPSYFHTVIAAPSANSSSDSLILFYDDLSVPAAGKAKLRFVNLYEQEAVDLVKAGVPSPLFSSTLYGRAGGSALEGESLNTFSLGPFIQIDAGAANLSVSRSSNHSGVVINGDGLSGLTFEAGKIYTIILSREPGNTEGTKAIIIQHN